MICPYGYWIGPEGQIEPVDDWQGHNDKAYEIAEKYDLGRKAGTWFELGNRGWIAVTVNQHLSHLSFVIHARFPRRQAEAVLQMCAAHGTEVFIDFTTFVDPLAWGRYVRERITADDAPMPDRSRMESELP